MLRYVVLPLLLFPLASLAEYTSCQVGLRGDNKPHLYETINSPDPSRSYMAYHCPIGGYFRVKHHLGERAPAQCETPDPLSSTPRQWPGGGSNGDGAHLSAKRFLWLTQVRDEANDGTLFPDYLYWDQVRNDWWSATCRWSGSINTNTTPGGNPTPGSRGITTGLEPAHIARGRQPEGVEALIVFAGREASKPLCAHLIWSPAVFTYRGSVRAILESDQPFGMCKSPIRFASAVCDELVLDYPAGIGNEYICVAPAADDVSGDWYVTLFEYEDSEE